MAGRETQKARIAGLHEMAEMALGRSHAYSRQKLVAGLRAALAELEAVTARETRMREALEAVQAQQPATLEWIRRHGIVFDGPLGTDPSDWEHVAFSIYTDLCETEAIATAALSADDTKGATE